MLARSWPAVRGAPRSAQRPLPSMMTATCSGTSLDGQVGGPGAAARGAAVVTLASRRGANRGRGGCRGRPDPTPQRGTDRGRSALDVLGERRPRSRCQCEVGRDQPAGLACGGAPRSLSADRPVAGEQRAESWTVSPAGVAEPGSRHSGHSTPPADGLKSGAGGLGAAEAQSSNDGRVAGDRQRAEQGRESSTWPARALPRSAHAAPPTSSRNCWTGAPSPRPTSRSASRASRARGVALVVEPDPAGTGRSSRPA